MHYGRHRKEVARFSNLRTHSTAAFIRYNRRNDNLDKSGLGNVRQSPTRRRGYGGRLDDARAGARTAVILLGLPALFPLAVMLPSVVRLSGVTHDAGNDVLGTGGAMLLFATLAITPLVYITGYRWFVPLRRWYGIIFALDVILDAIIAANDPAFGNSIQQDLTGHTFLLVGLAMVIISIPLLLTALNKRTMRWLGRYWKRIQLVGTYTIFGLLGLHLLLLDGFSPGHAPDTLPFTILHQRIYEYLACAIPLIIFRLPIARRSETFRKWATPPCIFLFTVGFLLFANELLFKGMAAYTLHPISD